MQTRYKFTKKLTLAAGSAVAAAVPATADAALVTKTTAVSISQFDFAPGLGESILYAPWDIDGDGNANMNLFAIGGRATSGSLAFGYLGFAQKSSILSDLVVGLGKTTASTNDLAVPTSVAVNPGSYPAGYSFAPLVLFGNGPFGTFSGDFLRALAAGTGIRSTASGALVSATGTDFGSSPFSFGTHNFAFAFFGFDGPHVGWGVLSLSPTSLSIDEWTYNTNSAESPNGGIHVGTRAAVPEPASTLPAIALLAAGAAGVRSWRKRKAATTAN